MKKEEIREELKQIAPNMPLPGNTSFFTLPDNYFSSVQQQIFQKIKLEEQWKNAADPTLSPVLSQMKHSKAFSIPEKYFSESLEKAINVIRKLETTAELQHIAPHLEPLRAHHSFLVPDKYFEKLPGVLLARVLKPQSTNKQKHTLIEKVEVAAEKFLSYFFIPRWAPVFATACTFAITFLLWFFHRDYHYSSSEMLSSSLMKVEAEEVSRYVAANMDEFEVDFLKNKSLQSESIFTFQHSPIEEKYLKEIILPELDEDALLKLDNKNKETGLI